MNDAPLPEEPANLKFLRKLVTVLTGTMIVGVVVIIGLIVMRFTRVDAPMALPDRITLPDGAKATAFTQGTGWYAIVTDNNEILIYDADSGALRQSIKINP